MKKISMFILLNYVAYPEIKNKKIRKIVNDIKPNLINERVNLNPRVIVNYIVDDSDIEISINRFKQSTNRNVITVSNIESDQVNKVIKDVNELTNIINDADINDIIYITFNKQFVKEIKSFFQK